MARLIVLFPLTGEERIRVGEEVLGDETFGDEVAVVVGEETVEQVVLLPLWSSILS